MTEDELREWVAQRWGATDWTGAQVRVGAFHRVVVPAIGPLVRAAFGTGHPGRVARELRTARLVAGLGLTLPVPEVLDGPVGDDAMTALLISRTPGGAAPDRTWDADLARDYRSLLGELAAVEGHRLVGLPPVRAWCGGPDWPAVVRRVTEPLSRELRPLADRLVATVLEAEQEQEPCFVHGDLGPHNILWEDGRPASLIDFDHACVGDPAVDVAPLVGAYGAAAVAMIVEPELLDRAMWHRATLSLQVSAGAHLIGQDDLRDFALDNFRRRAAAGVLYDPHGARPVRRRGG